MNRKELLLDTFNTVFHRLSQRNLDERVSVRVDITRDFSSRGVMQSGMYVQAISNLYKDSIHRLFFGFVEELAQLYKEGKKNEPTFFWDTCREFLLPRLDADIKSSKATIKSHIAQTMGQTTSIGQSLDRSFEHNSHTLKASVTNYIKENQLRFSFVLTKSHEERIALQIPDVAVMMWFPEKDTPEFNQSVKRFNLTKALIQRLSNDRATVNKFDDPNVIPSHQITPSVEVWLQKAAIVICDFTGCRGNVYYEFGYSKAAGTDLICICNRSEIDNLPSHIKGYQMIAFDSLEELEEQLVSKLSILLQRAELLGA